MPLHDLTPELRTRLNRVEKNVGWFVIVATVILVGGFVYYVYSTAKSRGWFITKLNFATGINDASGIEVGQPVRLMGFEVGDVTAVLPNPPEKTRGVTIFFRIRDHYWDYVWWDSAIRVQSDFLGHRFLEVEKGRHGVRSVITNESGKLLALNRWAAYREYLKLAADATNSPANTNLPMEVVLTQVTNQLMDMISNHVSDYYTNAFHARYNSQPASTNYSNYFYIPAIDAPSLSDRLDAVAGEVERAMPNILHLTNDLAAVLSNANRTVQEAQLAVAETRPTLTNLAVITENLRATNGSLGNWLLPSNLQTQLQLTLQSARSALDAARTTLDTTDTNETMLAVDLDHSLQHLSDLTSNLAWQVQINSNLVSDISTTILHTDDLVQGLKREWFLRGPFKKKKTEQKK